MAGLYGLPHGVHSLPMPPVVPQTVIFIVCS